MGGKVDLHLHTTYSDGTLSPSEIIERAGLAGITTLSITDHDSTGGIDEAMAAGRENGITVIPGVELSAMVGEQDVHLLGYFIDHTHQQLQEYLALFRNARIKRAERIVARLNTLGLPLQFTAVLAQAGKGAIGRPHIAKALVEERLVASYQDAFLRYLGFGRPAYEPKYHISPQEAIGIITSAGGLSFLAHPGNNLEEQTVLDLIKDGIDGIEVVHPSHSEELTAYYRGIAGEYFLLMSGGSDFHGEIKNDREILGRYTITDNDVAMMRRRLH